MWCPTPVALRARSRALNTSPKKRGDNLSPCFSTSDGDASAVVTTSGSIAKLVRAQLRKTLTRNHRLRTVSYRNPKSSGDHAKPLTLEKRPLSYPVEGVVSPPDVTTPSTRRINTPAYRIPASRGWALGDRTKPKSRAKRREA